MYRKSLSAFLFLLSTQTFAETALEFRDAENNEIRESLYTASAIDGQRGLSSIEVVARFGKPDSLSSESSWDGGSVYIYRLSNDRSLKIDILKGNVVQALIVTKGHEDFLVWK